MQGERLRGCVGDISFRHSLGKVLGAMTRAAALEDPRFPPLESTDVPSIRIEISRLSPLRRARHEEVIVGRHGVAVRFNGRSGLLLPKVAIEFGCDAAAFLRLACRKAGLPETAAGDPELILEIFEAEVIEE